MADFLTSEWFAEINATLASRKLAATDTWRVVLSWDDGPAQLPHAVTFSAAGGLLAVEHGDHLAADAVIVLSYQDAKALATGELDTAAALREGRIKLRGDSAVVVAMANAIRA